MVTNLPQRYQARENLDNENNTVSLHIDGNNRKKKSENRFHMSNTTLMKPLINSIDLIRVIEQGKVSYFRVFNVALYMWVNGLQ